MTDIETQIALAFLISGDIVEALERVRATSGDAWTTELEQRLEREREIAKERRLQEFLTGMRRALGIRS